MSILILILNTVRQLGRQLNDQHADTRARVELAEARQVQRLAVLRDSLEGRLLVLQHAVAAVQDGVDQVNNKLSIGAAASFQFNATLNGHTTYGVTMQTLTDSQKVLLTIDNVKDAKGAPATLDGPISWATSDETVGTMASDGWLSGVRPGTCTITATGDADLGEGVKPINGTLEVTVTAGEAVQFEITAGTPEAQ